MKPVLEVRGLSRYFGGLKAVSDVSLTVSEHEIVALIGPNGAGKTTFFNCVTGIYTPSAGDVLLHSEGQTTRLNGKKPHQITALGMARTFQNIRLFPGMTVLENVMLGRHCRTKAGVLGALLRNTATRQEEQETVDRAYELLRSVNLHNAYASTAKNLPYGAQRRLEIARALATDPSVLLLDEPAAGMNPFETRELENLVKDIRKKYNLCVLLIEHDMNMVMSMSDRIYVMEHGSCIAEGTPEQIRHNPKVIKAYLGEESDA